MLFTQEDSLTFEKNCIWRKNSEKTSIELKLQNNEDVFSSIVYEMNNFK